MKQKEKAIKYSKWTSAFFYVFGCLFVFITIAGMIYSYTNLIQLSSEISYTENAVKSNFWPVFTEITMVCLGVLVLVVRLNRWPKQIMFKILFYIFALIVLLANGYNTSIIESIDINGIVDLAIQELPVICYLVLLEIALYVITNVINDRIKVEIKPHQTVENRTPDKLEQQRDKNKLTKEENKKLFLDILKHNPTISQNKACEKLNLTHGVGTTYVRELKESKQLDKNGDEWVVYEII